MSDKLVAKRSEQFRKFNRVYIHEKKIYVKTFEDIEKKQEIKSNDFFVVGSDQVWNPRLTGAAPEYFLKFAPCEKRVALSASIGIETVDNQYFDTFKDGIKEMKYISVREDTARNIIQKITGRVSDVFLDPTFLICVDKWHSLIKKPKYSLPDNYILTFFLREEPQQSVSLCEKMFGYEVIRMNNKNYPEMYALDPSEFLYMIKNAELILTDSFHATVFSILFHKQFFVYRRKHKNPEYMFTRLSTLLDRFQLDDRVQNRGDFVKKCDISVEKYNIIDNEIKMERQRVKEILGTVFMG